MPSIFPIPRTIPGEVNNKLYYETELGNTSVDFTVQIPEVSISGLYNEFALPGSSIKVNGAYFDLYGFGGGEESSTITMNGVALEVDSLTEQYMSIVIPEILRITLRLFSLGKVQAEQRQSVFLIAIQPVFFGTWTLPTSTASGREPN